MAEPRAASQAAMFGLDLHDPGQRERLERALEGIPGVTAVRIVPGYDRPIDELHALVALDRAPKQVVRDVQSLLFTRFDLSIDHRVISVVQLDDDDPIVLDQEPAPARAALTRTAITQAAASTGVMVVIADEDGVEHIGESTGQPSVSGTRTAAAEATLAAMGSLLGDSVSTALQALRVVDGGEEEVAVAVMSVRVRRTEMRVCGSALVRRGEVDAIARSILDALNRVVLLAE